MQAKLIRFGEIEIDGQRYDHDVLIENGLVRKRKKKPSKIYRDQFGHTPLSIEEAIPWGGERLVIGTGLYGSLPVMSEVYEEAERRGIEMIVLPTPDACDLLNQADPETLNAILHITC